MAETKKRLSEYDANLIAQKNFVNEDASQVISGFLVGKVGRKIDLTITTTTVANDTEEYSFSEDGNALYSLRIIYTSGTREILLSAERIS